MNAKQLRTAATKAKNPDTKRKYMARYKLAVKSERLQALVEGCGACAKAQKTRTAKGWEGPSRANLALVGDSRASFKAKDGATLRLAMSAVGLEWDKATKINPLCLLHENRVFDLVNPLIVVVLGFMPVIRPQFAKGRFKYDMRPPSWFRRRNDMAGLVAALSPLADVVNGWAALPLEEIPELSDANVAHAIEAQGWVKIYSAIIGDTLVVTDREPSELPAETSAYPIYTIEELGRIRMLADQKMMDTRMLRATHEVKKAFGRSLVTI